MADRSQKAERTRARFDRWAGWYDRNWSQALFFDRVHRQVIEAAVRSGVQPRVILDVGCGTGRLLLRVRTAFPQAHLVGVDLSPAMIEQARLKVPEHAPMHFEVAGVEKLPFPEASFDLAFSTISFHHWSDRMAGLCEVARVLRPAGIFVLADLSVGGPFWPLLWLFGRLHGSFQTGSERGRMLAQAGLVVRSQRYSAALGWGVLISVAERS